MSALRPKFMLRSILILSRSCCIDLRTARCLRAYWTMFNDHFAKNSRSFGNSVLEAPDRPVVIIIPLTMERSGGWVGGGLPMLVRSVGRDQRPWNKGLLIGQKRPLEPKHVWSIRVRLEIARSPRDLVIFNLAIDSKLRACADGQAVVCPLLRGSSPTRWVAPKQHRGAAFNPSCWPQARARRAATVASRSRSRSRQVAYDPHITRPARLVAGQN
jgi:hypothetical protein